MKRRAAIALAVALALLLCGCGKRRDPYADVPNPIATITLGNGRQMRLELYPRYAPNTVANFIDLANRGFYDGTQIFRVVSNVLIQGGSPTNDLTGDPGYYIKGEFAANDFSGNSLSHVRGTISMARKSDYDTAGSQFFIMEGYYPSDYDGLYAAFGSIADETSLSVLDDIGSMPVDGSNVPLDKIIVTSIRVETFDVEYKLEKLKKDEVDKRREGKKK